MKRLGIFGGSFSPPHNGHTRAACSFLDQLHLDSLLVIPAYIPPHKSSEMDARTRFEMTQIAFRDTSVKIEVSDYEIKKADISYSFETLEHFLSEADELFMLCGTDMFLSLDTWRCPEKIFSLASVVCIPRENGDSEEISEKSLYYREKFGALCTLLSCEPYEISSSEIRRKLAAGEDVSSYISPDVLSYINERKLYQNG